MRKMSTTYEFTEIEFYTLRVEFDNLIYCIECLNKRALDFKLESEVDSVERIKEQIEDVKEKIINNYIYDTNKGIVCVELTDYDLEIIEYVHEKLYGILEIV